MIPFIVLLFLWLVLISNKKQELGLPLLRFLPGITDIPLWPKCLWRSLKDQHPVALPVVLVFYLDCSSCDLDGYRF